jgi:hypothetical protein
MRAGRRRALLIAPAVFALYFLTWVVAERTLVDQLKASLVDDGVEFFARNNPETSRADNRTQLTNALNNTEFHLDLTHVVPLLPGLVVVCYEMSGKFRPGGIAGFGGTVVTVRLVYGVGSKSLYSRTLGWGP